MKFYRCAHCGNIVTFLNNSGVPVICCGEKMGEITPNTTDGATEKHVPVYEVKDGAVTVKVGSAPHPMTEPHYIQWIIVETNEGIHRKDLTPADAPEASFALKDGEKVTAVYEYCNLHGLWKA